MKEFELNSESLHKAWGATGQYWFSLKDNVIKDEFQLSSLDVPNDVSQLSYYVTLGYIPYFTVSDEEIMRHYLSNLSDVKLIKHFSKIDESNFVESFWKHANLYPQITAVWAEYEDKYILEKGIAWCEQNGIKYVIK